jgi:hypothetical protein
MAYRIQLSYAEGELQEEATFYSAEFRGVAMHVIKRYRYEYQA